MSSTPEAVNDSAARTGRRRLTQGAVLTFGLNGFSIASAFAITLVLARSLGVAGYGAYAYVMAWIGGLSTVAVVGMDTLLVRSLATYQTRGQWALMSGLLRHSNKTVLRTSLVLAVLTAALSQLFARADTKLVFLIAAVLLPLLSLAQLRQAALQGLHQAALGLMPDSLVRPVTFLTLLGAGILFSGKHLSPEAATTANLVSALLSLLLGVTLIRRYVPAPARAASPQYETAVWRRAALPLLFLSNASVLNGQADILLLGILRDSKAVAIFTVATRLAGLIALPLFAINTIMGPTIASLHAAGNMQRLQHIVTRSAHAILVFSALMMVILLGASPWLLRFFGPSFIAARPAFIILSVGQIVNAAMGSVGLLLVMMGHERDVAISYGVSAFLSILLNIALIPRYAENGAAVATATYIILWNIALAIWLYRKTGINSTVFGRVRSSHATIDKPPA